MGTPDVLLFYNKPPSAVNMKKIILSSSTGKVLNNENGSLHKQKITQNFINIDAYVYIQNGQNVLVRSDSIKKR